jgi:hypothetical protein
MKVYRVESDENRIRLIELDEFQVRQRYNNIFFAVVVAIILLGASLLLGACGYDVAIDANGGVVKATRPGSVTTPTVVVQPAPAPISGS